MHEDACKLGIENAWGCMQARNRGCMQARKLPMFNLQYIKLDFRCSLVGRVAEWKPGVHGFNPYLTPSIHIYVHDTIVHLRYLRISLWSSNHNIIFSIYSYLPIQSSLYTLIFLSIICLLITLCNIDKNLLVVFTHPHELVIAYKILMWFIFQLSWEKISLNFPWANKERVGFFGLKFQAQEKTL